MLLQTKNLSVNYGKAQALRDITISVQEKSFIALIGPNGAGKTTFLKAISGLIKVTSGEIWFNGKRIDGMDAADITRLGIVHVPEGRLIFSPMNVLDNLLIGAYLCKEKNEIARNLQIVYNHFPILKERLKQKAGSLSGGEQQMLAIGRALMSNPKLLLMDEPSNGLSPMMVREIGHVIKNINFSGIGIVLVEQNARLALKLAKKVYVLYIGSIIMEGDASNILGEQYIREILSQ